MLWALALSAGNVLTTSRMFRLIISVGFGFDGIDFPSDIAHTHTHQRLSLRVCLSHLIFHDGGKVHRQDFEQQLHNIASIQVIILFNLFFIFIQSYHSTIKHTFDCKLLVKFVENNKSELCLI